MKRALEAFHRRLATHPRLRYALREWALPVGLPLGAIAAFALPLAQGVSVKRMISFRFVLLAALITAVAVVTTLVLSWLVTRLGLLPFDDSE